MESLIQTPVGNKSSSKSLSDLQSHHLADLQSSGLEDYTIKVAGLRSVSSTEARQKLRWGKEVGPCLEIPYPSIGGEPLFSRFKPDKPPLDKEGRPAKYLTPSGAHNRLYFPATLNRESLSDSSRPMLVTEGEKKALAVVQAGYDCISLAGVWCWRSGKKPVQDLDYVTWKNRLAYLVFDSDLKDNQSVRRAERALAKELEERGAIVKLVRLPGGPNGEKVGLDDFLIKYGVSGLPPILDSAQLASTDRPDSPSGKGGVTPNS